MREFKEAVPVSVRRLLDRLADVGIFEEFYLAGGTGLALLLAHRQSVDLDFFSRANPLDGRSRRLLLRRLRPLPGWKLEEAKEGTVHGQLGKVRVSFFWFPEPLVKPLVRRGSLRIASLEDIGLMKIGALIGRGSRKDFVDLFEICQKVALSRILSLSRKKFKDSRDFLVQAFKALSYFEDAEKEPLVISLKPFSWGRLKAFFTQEVQRLARQYLERPGAE